MPRVILLLLFPILLLSACRSQTDATGNTAAMAVPPRQKAQAQLARGLALFQQNCAVCHGAAAQGAFNWHTPGPDGKYLPPPLNGTGHDWHHPKAALQQTIRMVRWCYVATCRHGATSCRSRHGADQLNCANLAAI